MTKAPVSHSKDPDLQKAPQALLRASEKARLLAEQTGAPFVVRQPAKPSTLDRAVDACYRKAAFANDAQRVEFLFERYQQLTSLLPTTSAKKTRKSKA